MRFSTALVSLAATLPLVSAVDFNSFNDPQCNGFQEHYHLNPNSKGNLADTRRSFLVNGAQAGCHLKFYTGLNQAPNDGSTLSFTTETDNECYWTSDNRQFRSFGFYCP
ncbi:hypothetical protein K491DRAFT_763094 [Lophiostoma macrostomum CBS 122681]|uniref:AA1-like domain-containing protein n=1 Tax=Lophiostoma macrostomum CBS 122681 TaxID=1314788 RepID=A0A6A6SN77_9PLEO|nr:hypothetical protein K491DRAFT_763094 [Lophiostoma macrostomum CBS 122681]